MHELKVHLYSTQLRVSVHTTLAQHWSTFTKVRRCSHWLVASHAVTFEASLSVPTDLLTVVCVSGVAFIDICRILVHDIGLATWSVS